MSTVWFFESYENYICHKSRVVTDGVWEPVVHAFIKGPSSAFPARGQGSWAMSLPAFWGEGVKPFGEGTALSLSQLFSTSDSLLFGPSLCPVLYVQTSVLWWLSIQKGFLSVQPLTLWTVKMKVKIGNPFFMQQFSWIFVSTHVDYTINKCRPFIL